MRRNALKSEREEEDRERESEESASDDERGWRGLAKEAARGRTRRRRVRGNCALTRARGLELRDSNRQNGTDVRAIRLDGAVLNARNPK